ncbi:MULTISPECIES: pyruvate formate-lyase-activating protein [unclassified Microbacterium]|uniref:pyruvate formate-lyase-activating protein n=1 Tax=unclassified Microbacterium TaxID=2609290 RepID=UPI00214C6B21|nr:MULTISPECIES: pyruvate formate-lyase-activating protein [unclassified Microbacterium]MCR2785357.1 pyruvate formate-lyase-activating protein [Microbacterium sp. zg.B96]MDL5353008.1 pyruvate formate-lyase-activating protein [Microbacterium sp. zg-YB36]WIM17563.1 pyruvate formate-lyase-activating protein [Microbacterium sp. zg-B96]
MLVPAPNVTRPDSDGHHARLEAMRTGRVASVHSWELVTSVDGPGTRMTLFLAGCPLRCQYCHNPDTWQQRDGAKTDIDDILARLRRYLPVFQATGGGLTISGGEPMQQPAFVTRLAAEASKLGIHVALDTSGNLGRNASDALLKDLDLVLLDVKSGLPDLYREVTGRELKPTLDFGDRLAAHGVPVWIRFVLVPGLTDSPENIEAVAEIVSRWPNVARVEVLPFHQMGTSKWERLDIPYPLADTQPPEADAVEAAREHFRARGLVTY